MVQRIEISLKGALIGQKVGLTLGLIICYLSLQNILHCYIDYSSSMDKVNGSQHITVPNAKWQMTR